MEMKCKACDGMGTSNWCINGTFKTCEVCGGTGHVEFPMMSMNGDEYTGEWEQHECDACNGTGQAKKTNFEDVTSSPERLADFLETVKNACFDCASRGPYKSPDCPFADAKDDPYKCNILEWLKQEEK